MGHPPLPGQVSKWDWVEDFNSRLVFKPGISWLDTVPQQNTLAIMKRA